MLALIVYVLVGFLLANGLPHFVAGSANAQFRTPFGRSPKVNLAWGMVSFLAAVILFTWRLTIDGAAHGQMIAIVVGIGLGYAAFGFMAGSLFEERDPNGLKK